MSAPPMDTGPVQGQSNAVARESTTHNKQHY